MYEAYLEDSITTNACTTADNERAMGCHDGRVPLQYLPTAISTTTIVEKMTKLNRAGHLLELLYSVHGLSCPHYGPRIGANSALSSYPNG